MAQQVFFDVGGRPRSAQAKSLSLEKEKSMSLPWIEVGTSNQNRRHSIGFATSLDKSGTSKYPILTVHVMHLHNSQSLAEVRHWACHSNQSSQGYLCVTLIF